jgi:tRNA(Ile)-lysidine synthase
MTPIPPITSIEFATALRRCKPPGGWLTSLGRVISPLKTHRLRCQRTAVANSGGPDSTCLLYLLKSILASDAAEPLTSDSPKNLLSLAVDHGFQTSSAAMADVAAGNAKRLRIEHVTSSIPWSTAPFPPKPASGIETDARESRYRVLLDNMIAKNVYTLALGHHAGDQQETALMRFMRNGKHRIIDLHAMRHVRRWGMGEGSVGRVGFAGMDGMSRWLVRPLLGFSKVIITSRWRPMSN